jgi:cytochrome c
MRRILLTTAFGLLATTPAFASLELAQKNNCMACHTLEKKLVGPSFADVAKRYADRAGAEATLAKNIKEGGSGRWGPVPMPAQAALSDADSKDLAGWILQRAKQ